MEAQTQVVLLEDNTREVARIEEALAKEIPALSLEHIRSKNDYLQRLRAGRVDTVLSDGSVAGCERLTALHQLRERHPHAPFFYLTDRDDEVRDVHGLHALGMSDFFSKAKLDVLGQEIRKALELRALAPSRDLRLIEGYERLVSVVKELSLVRDLAEIMAIVRTAARELTGADGATFVLREGNQCYYADEDAIGPLWKGQKFPMQACISGWAMVNKHPAVVEDIFSDARIPVSAYEPTFVRSVAMVPIRALDPIGAIGNYWAVKRLPDAREVRLLQALADTTAVAMENVRVRNELEQRVRERTADLESFAYAISHDLRAPVRHMQSFASMIIEDHGETLNEDCKLGLDRIKHSSNMMGAMIEGMFELSRMARAPLKRQRVDLGVLAHEIAGECRLTYKHAAEFLAPEHLDVDGDPVLLRVALLNLIGNAWKFSGKTAAPRIVFGSDQKDGKSVYFVRDNGAGFDASKSHNLFGIFQRFHTQQEFPGTGVGLATVNRIVQKHGGRLWAESQSGKGAAFFFTLNELPDRA